MDDRIWLTYVMLKVMDDGWNGEWIMKGEWVLMSDERMQWWQDEYTYEINDLKIWRKIEGLVVKVEMMKVDEKGSKEVDFLEDLKYIEEKGKINKSCCEILSCTNIYTKK